jgi:organic radical activating enzyme
MTYAVKEIFKTLQGEGAQAGRVAVFCRFAGCNLWSGREDDRAEAVCRFCDTDFVGTDGAGGGKFATATLLARAITEAWPPDGIDWLCVSPKADAALAVAGGDELKLVFPQDEIDPAGLTGLKFRHFFLQPMDGPARLANTEAAVAFCLANPTWRLSLQTHKVIGIP